MTRYALITGGELKNKGAQAMSFLAVSELAKRFPDLTPVLVSPIDTKPDILDMMRGRKDATDLRPFAFDVVYGNTPDAKAYLLGRSPSLKQRVKRMVRAKDFKHLAHLYENADLVIDISGFAFGKGWGFRNCMSYLDGIAVARRYKVPLYLMPQSFGPFDLSSEAERAQLERYARDVLAYPRIIFARERSGYESLRELCPSARLELSSDMVLQSDGVDQDVIFVDGAFAPKAEDVATTKNVGIVPNVRNIDKVGEPALLSLYERMIQKLLDRDYHVYIIRHASEDLVLCERVKELFRDDMRVHVLDADSYCFEYGKVFAACDFVIASRYHSIVHAYHAGTPCIALGWADKYTELLRAFGEDDMVFNVAEDRFCEEALMDSLDVMSSEFKQRSVHIASMLGGIRASSVFDTIDRDMHAETDR